MRVSLFIPCLVDQLKPETGNAVKEVLERIGCTTYYNPRQTCCGQALFNMGFRSEARDLAVRFIKVFAKEEYIVSPSGSCVSMVVKHYEELDLPVWAQREWLSLRTRVWEFSDFLVNCIKTVDVGACFPHTVSVHHSCHMLRELEVRSTIEILLQNTSEVKLIGGTWEEECCGFGGAFSAKYPELSHAIGNRRAETLSSGKAEFITGGDDSCLNQLQQSFYRLSLPQKTMHIARILAHTDKKNVPSSPQSKTGVVS